MGELLSDAKTGRSNLVDEDVFWMPRPERVAERAIETVEPECFTGHAAIPRAPDLRKYGSFCYTRGNAAKHSSGHV